MRDTGLKRGGSWGLLGLLVGLGLAAALGPLTTRAAPTAPRYIRVEARMFAFQPYRIRVQQGERVVLELVAMDVVHGLYVDGYDVQVTADPGVPARLAFVADRPGKFRFRCSTTCGALHPFMIGELVVEPNAPYTWAVALTFLVALGTLGYLHGFRTGAPNAASRDLLRLPWLRRLLRWRGFQWTLVIVPLFFFVLAILTGLFGTPVGNRNFSIIFVWIVWWALLIVLLVPVAGRLWCAMCPIPVPGEWLQRRAFIGRRPGRLWTLGWRWPRRLRNIWLQNAAFLGVALFSAILLTRPRVTAIVLLGFVLLALGLSLLFERRVFCRYVCPVGGFIGLYANAAPLELRVRDPEVCRRHAVKECFVGNARGYGCPWLVFPGSLDRNAYCGLCMECVKTCSQDNIALNLRLPGRDLLVARGRRLDEAYKGFIMLGCALLYSAVFLGPWGWLKDAANLEDLGRYLAYAAALLGLNLLFLPGVFLGCAWLARRVGGLRVGVRRAFIDYAYALVPLGLLAWIAFSLAFVFANGSYVLAVISDPFGWGWDLFGTRDFPWRPFLSQLVAPLQTLLLLAGLAAGMVLTYRIGRQAGLDHGGALRATLPIAAFLMATTGAFLWLYLG